MRVLLTGVAGFIGSNLAKNLLDNNIAVIGIDNFFPNYDRALKERNIEELSRNPNFKFQKVSIEEELEKVSFEGLDVLLHLSALPGVRKSWGEKFYEYTNNNILATQKILERLKEESHIKLIYASSSSIYGETEPVPFNEDNSPPRPKSPYGVTKLAGEHLIDLYAQNYGIKATTLRLFTVYGPGQRPDMAFHKFFTMVHNNEPLQIFGSLNYSRDYTYVDDVVLSFLSVIEGDEWGCKMNIGSARVYSLGEIIEIMGEITGKKIKYDVVSDVPGDVNKTYADITKAIETINYNPEWDLIDGLREEYRWIREIYNL